MKNINRIVCFLIIIRMTALSSCKKDDNPAKNELLNFLRN
jgi:hypothetical protein